VLAGARAGCGACGLNWIACRNCIGKVGRSVDGEVRWRTGRRLVSQPDAMPACIERR
jgi:hypothetical protein